MWVFYAKTACILNSIQYNIYYGSSLCCVVTLACRDKEVHLPFPQEHPYTSHISRFAVFPDTNHHPPRPPPSSVSVPAGKVTQHPQESTKDCNTTGPTTQDTLLPRTASVQTQTTLTAFKPLPAYYVPQKAGEWGLRVEEHHLSVPGIASLNPDVGRTFWDLPRSRQHRVSIQKRVQCSDVVVYSCYIIVWPLTMASTYASESLEGLPIISG